MVRSKVISTRNLAIENNSEVNLSLQPQTGGQHLHGFNGKKSPKEAEENKNINFVCLYFTRFQGLEKAFSISII